jgi:hypothetical protein
MSKLQMGSKEWMAATAEACRRITALLSDPQPGIAMWASMLGEQVEKMHTLTTPPAQIVEDPSNRMPAPEAIEAIGAWWRANIVVKLLKRIGAVRDSMHSKNGWDWRAAGYSYDPDEQHHAQLQGLMQQLDNMLRAKQLDEQLADTEREPKVPNVIPCNGPTAYGACARPLGHDGECALQHSRHIHQCLRGLEQLYEAAMRDTRLNEGTAVQRLQTADLYTSIRDMIKRVLGG